MLHHVAFPSANWNECIGFYVNLLGMRLVKTFARSDGTRIGILQCPVTGARLEFIEQLNPTHGAAGCDQHICFATDDLEALLDRMARSGAAAREVVSYEREVIAFVSDPEGRTIELNQGIHRIV